MNPERLHIAVLNIAMLNIAVLIALVASGLVACDRPDDSVASQASEQASASNNSSVDVDAIVSDLEDGDVSDAERLDAIHQAREAGVGEAIPALRGLLEADDLEIVVAAAAALAGLDAEDAGGDIVEAASRLSRSHDFEYLRQLLFIIGDVGGPQARIYVETVAEGHQVPAIRQTAAQVLQDMKQ
jgi:HEAT repeat protein